MNQFKVEEDIVTEQDNSSRACRTDRVTALAKVHAMRCVPPVGEDLVEAFSNCLVGQGGVVQKITSLEEIPLYIESSIVKGGADKTSIALGNNETLLSLNWENNGLFNLVTTEAIQHGGISVSMAEIAVAETGSLVLLSGAENPTLNNFLPDDHVVVVREDDIVSYQEDMWKALRQRCPDGLPRAVNLISGPSSTGDVAMTFVFGAHGPVKLHALILK